jgi:hypothetical protein
MNKKSNRQINKIITEHLFGCYHEIAKLPGEDCHNCVHCRELRGISPTEEVNRDFCRDDADIRAAREKIAEKGLQDKYGEQLLIELGLEHLEANWLGDSYKEMFLVSHAEPIQQARAICRVLENL